jgi:hypothetical protein
VPRGAGLKAMRTAVTSMMARPGAPEAPDEPLGDPQDVAPPGDPQDVEQGAETTDRPAP